MVVISYDYWKSKLDGAPDVVGRKLLLNRYPMTIIGVAPAAFRGVEKEWRLPVPVTAIGEVVPKGYTIVRDGRERKAEPRGFDISTT